MLSMIGTALLYCFAAVGVLCTLYGLFQAIRIIIVIRAFTNQ